MAYRKKPVKKKVLKKKPPQETFNPVWKGPEGDGVTQSLLSRFLTCRERFRLLTIEGIQEKEGFNHRLEYGNMWHLCEETLAASPGMELWRGVLKKYCTELTTRYQNPSDREAISKWYEICKRQFAIYVEYWSKHKDVVQRTPLLQEERFDVPYELPSGRVVRLRGKWDHVDLVGKGKKASVYLQENKTKGDIQEERLKTELAFNLQTMFYITALERLREIHDGQPLVKGAPKDLFTKPLRGVIYNVVRRPLGDWRGKFNIKQRKGRQTKKGIVGAETEQEYYDRLAELIEENADHFFMRWKIELTNEDISRFRRECFDPILESLWDWWEWIKWVPELPFRPGDIPPHHSACNAYHYRFPFGVYNPLMEGRAGAYAEYLATGSVTGLERISELFPELQ